MAQGSLNAGSITAYIGTIYEDALMVARDQNVMAGLVTTFSDRSDEAPRKNSEYNAGTVWDNLEETTDLDTQSLTPSVIATLTPKEQGAQFLLHDRRMRSDPFPIMQDAALELGTTLGKAVNSDLLAAMGSVDGGTIGAAGSTMTWDYFFAARAVLRGTKAPEPYHCVLHEYAWYELAKAASVAGVTVNQGQLQDAVQQRYYVGNVAGVNIYTTVDIAEGTAITQAMFSSQALALDSRHPATLETERDASKRATELNMVQVYGYGTWRPGFGVQIISDASVPNP